MTATTAHVATERHSDLLAGITSEFQNVPFQTTVTGSRKEKLGVIPDRVFALEFGDKGERILCFLEADRGDDAG